MMVTALRRKRDKMALQYLGRICPALAVLLWMPIASTFLFSGCGQSPREQNSKAVAEKSSGGAAGATPQVGEEKMTDDLPTRCEAYLREGPPAQMENYVPESLTEIIIAY